MSIRIQFGVMAMVLAMGCGGEGAAPSETDTSSNSIKACRDASCIDSNCDELNQPYQGPGSDFTMTSGEWPTTYRYKVTSFYLDTATKAWRVRGYHVLQDPSNPVHTQADGAVTLITPDFTSHQITNMSALAPSPEMAVTYCDDKLCSSQSLVMGAELVKIKLSLDIPNPPGMRGITNFTWDFTGDLLRPLEPKDKWSDDIHGIQVNWSTKGILPSALCKGNAGESQLTVFQGQVQYQPKTFALTKNDLAVTVTCEKGAIAACGMWGYAPWYKGELLDGSATDMAVEQAACVRMKTADYCGTGQVHTKYGTEIMIHDPLDPTRHSAYGSANEAIWTDKGATCIDPLNRRHMDMPLACPGIATCGAKDWDALSSSQFISGLP